MRERPKMFVPRPHVAAKYRQLAHKVSLKMRLSRNTQRDHTDLDRLKQLSPFHLLGGHG